MFSLRDPFFPRICPCKLANGGLDSCFVLDSRRRRLFYGRKWRSPAAHMLRSDADGSAARSVKSAKEFLVSKRLSDELEYDEPETEPRPADERAQVGSSFANYQADPLVDKLRTQLGVIHPIPSPPINRNIVGFFVFFFFFGVVFDKLWTARKRNRSARDVQPTMWPQVPTSFSLFLEKDLQRKESVEWVNMVLGKLWKVYRAGLENWIIGLLQPVIDNLKKPDYVQRVEIKQFSLGDEPLSVRNVERKTSRRVNDLQYQIGIRYTGGARMLLSLSLKFGIVPIVVPVGIRNFDIDGELWVKLRLIPTEPWVGAASWAFVSLPKIKFDLVPFRLFNIMAIPVLSMFLTKLLTEDLPRLFVRPKKIVLDFQKGEALGPVPDDIKSNEIQEGNKDFVGELSVTLVDARKLAYVIFGKTDPYVVLNLGDQVIRSKKNSQTTVIGPPGEPIWNQDFHLLVANPRKQRLSISVKDSLGFTDLTIGTGEIELASLKDTVPTDKIVSLQSGWGFLKRSSAGEILLRLTYKAYVEDEEEEAVKTNFVDNDASDDEMFGSEQANNKESKIEKERESFMDVLAALLVSEEFQGIVASETAFPRTFDDSKFPDSSGSRTRGRGADNSAGFADVCLMHFRTTAMSFLYFRIAVMCLLYLLPQTAHPQSPIATPTSVSFINHTFMICSHTLFTTCSSLTRIMLRSL